MIWIHIHEIPALCFPLARALSAGVPFLVRYMYQIPSVDTALDHVWPSWQVWVWHISYKKKKKNKKKIRQIFDTTTSVNTCIPNLVWCPPRRLRRIGRKKERKPLFTSSPQGQAYEAMSLPSPRLLYFGLKPINCLRRVSPFLVAIVLGKKENFSPSVYAFGRWYWKGWDLVLLLPPASDRYLFLSVVTRLLYIL